MATRIIEFATGYESDASSTSVAVNPMDDVGQLIIGGVDGTPTKVEAGPEGYLFQAGGLWLDPSTLTSDLEADIATLQSDVLLLDTRLDTAESEIDTLQAQIATKAEAADLAAHLSDSSDAHDASTISVVPGGNLAASDVQTALEELQADIDNRAPIATTVTLTGSQTVQNKDIDGGTASNTSRITVPKAATAILSGLTRKKGTLLYDTDTDSLKLDDGATLQTIPTGTPLTNPMTTSGDIIYGGTSGAATRLAGNTTTTRKVLSQTGNGSASAAPSWEDYPTTASGRFTPALTNGANIASSSANSCLYLRVGNIVTVSGVISCATTAAANTLSVISMTLPISSNLASTLDARGSGSREAASGTAYSAVSIEGDATNDRATFTFNSTSTSNLNVSFTFQYEIK